MATDIIGRVWKGVYRWYQEEYLDCCDPLDTIREKGITLTKFLCLARCNGLLVDGHSMTDTKTNTLELFREHIKLGTSDSGARMAVAYSRQGLGQYGDGHYSPIGAYHAASDQCLILDVARFKYPPHWVSVTALYEATKLIDSDSGKPRGWAVLRAGPSRTPLFFCVCTRGRQWQDFTATALNNVKLWYSYVVVCRPFIHCVLLCVTVLVASNVPLVLRSILRHRLRRLRRLRIATRVRVIV